ncbi:monofunctional biosynthetic peptidoglycan transglycosylase [Aquimarina sp. TRL1]|uniref:monofunctional biosynthetic peptidoglycan transglycosylase n=1 Tax=Aquimarina sp. (strain TRL1) TaxID=2736252 RepID=UPI00158AF68E|nr:monofunctional biosynthetic peptidoglycan transglycosylase [Aquimarina sp. TRL1]QKX04585.1 monofunctional biosynthetic peptidoglycan transglycosylase [Aquimarina sp. TRL1]
MKKIAGFIYRILFYFLVLSVAWVSLYKWVAVPITPLMIIRYINSDSKTIRHQWVPLDKISKNLQLAVICSEDQKFISHTGFDTAAIRKVIENNQGKKRMRGASTISQQTAKNVFLWSDRSWIRKGLETYFTFLIELLWDKERILEVYLNSIEMGNEVYGAQAAALFWFNKPASALSKKEATAIAAILPNPRKYIAFPASPYIQKRQQWIARQMANYGTFVLPNE